MGESSILWLRVAAGLYSLGLLHAVLTVLGANRLFSPSRSARSDWVRCSNLSPSWSSGSRRASFPVADIFETMSFCACVITVSFLAFTRATKRQPQYLHLPAGVSHDAGGSAAQPVFRVVEPRHPQHMAGGSRGAVAAGLRGPAVHRRRGRRLPRAGAPAETQKPQPHLHDAAAARHSGRTDFALAGRRLHLYHRRDRHCAASARPSSSARAGLATAASSSRSLPGPSIWRWSLSASAPDGEGGGPRSSRIVALCCCVATWLAQAHLERRLMQ